MSRLVALLLLGLAAGAPVLAHADAISEGQELAKKGEYERALAKFKQADAALPRAQTACLIGLAYFRGSHFPEAEVRFAQCRARAKAGEGALPDWLEAMARQLEARLAAFAPIEITTETDEPIEVSGWSDDPFEAQVIHLPAGRYTFTSGAASRTVEIESTARTEVHLVAPPVAAPLRAKPFRRQLGPARREPEASTPSSTYVLGTSAGLALLGIGLHILVVAPARTRLAAAPTVDDYDHRFAAYSDARYAVVGLYTAAAIALGIGLYLHHDETQARLAISGDAHGATVSVSWRR